MKKVRIITLIGLFAFLSSVSYAAKPTSVDSTGNETSWAQTECTMVSEGELVYPIGRHLAGQVIPTGFDPYGYNYQGHLFKGSYANVYLNADGFPPYMGDDVAYINANPTVTSKWYWGYRQYDLQMKWNDTWLSNSDCDGDDLLDRHYGFADYIGSGAWTTNQYGGEGWAALTKIQAVPGDAYLFDSMWYTADGIEIGEEIWDEFAITQDVLSSEGALYVSPAGPGFGKY